jgi:hypothetical protein
MGAVRLSVILVTDRYETIARVMKRLGAQTVADEIEVVIVAASKEDIDLDESIVSRLAAVVVAEAGSI